MVKKYKKNKQNKKGGWLWSRKNKSKSKKAGRAKKTSNIRKKYSSKTKKNL